MTEHFVEIDRAACVGCGLCKQDCPVNIIRLVDKKAVAERQGCIQCGHCVAICPKGAVSITGYDEQPVELKQQTRLHPQELLDAIKSRRSIRHFTERQIPDEVISRIIETGRFTPTGGNAQDVSYIVLKENLERCERIAVRLFRRVLFLVKPFFKAASRARIDDHFFFKEAPAAILILSKDKVNGAIAAANMALMAEACGLGVLYSGFFSAAAKYSPSLRRELQLKRKESVVMTLVLGYSKVSYRRTVQREPARVRGR